MNSEDLANWYNSDRYKQLNSEINPAHDDLEMNNNCVNVLLLLYDKILVSCKMHLCGSLILYVCNILILKDIYDSILMWVNKQFEQDVFSTSL